MKMSNMLRVSFLVITLTSLGMLSGCAHYEVNTGRGNVPGYYIRSEMQEADRAVEAARQAGKDKVCPDEFKAAEATKNSAFDVFRACHTEEGVALAKQATAKTNALCPSQAVKEEPVPVIQAPATPAPSDNLMITPNTIIKGETASLLWSSRNATNCDIQPGIGAVRPQGSLTITPSVDAAYTLICSGDGGTAKSTANISVNASVNAPAPIQPKAQAKLCSPTELDIKFDTNKADIKPRYHDELKKLADFLKEFPDAKGVIEGHTDNAGLKEMNMKLSQRRADSVRNYLVKHFGIAPERLGAKGFGPTKPIADNKTSAGKQKNRRIEANFTCGGK
ncbi:MAG: OmpA family protein [Oryzomonas sp.]|uniref:OmpA family protein n=1 Tax=Oryzomonas sp. TaxID=2855186 RepID=UPI0028496D9A|nr:OmpA family protein [Oryzomonas sp.]MDR3578866.1 OmpA family protein [Oryzomonas sp.]